MLVGLGRYGLMVLLLGVVCPVYAEKSEEPAHGGGGVSSTTLAPEIKTATPGERQFSMTEVEILQELDKRRIELDRREQALELREKLVDLMEAKLGERVAALNDLKAELESLVKSASGKDEQELTQLANIYGAMKPAAAAQVLNRLDNAIVLDVITRMPVKKSGKIMEALEPVKARYLSEMLAQKIDVSSSVLSQP